MTPPLTDFTFAAAIAGRSAPFARVDRRPCVEVVSWNETRIPAGCRALNSFLDLGTGGLTITNPVMDLVQTADRFRRILDVLPTDPEHEARIDMMLSAQIKGTAVKRPLRRVTK